MKQRKNSASDAVHYDEELLEKKLSELKNGEKKSRVTLCDIAEIVGVSKMTVSRALNNQGQISTPVMSAIKTVSEKLGYIADVHYTQIRRSVSKVMRPYIGLLIDQHEDGTLKMGGYTYRLLSGVETGVRKHGYTLVIAAICDCTTGGLPRVVSESRVDGVIVTNYVNSELYKNVDAVVPVVLANLHFSGFGFSSVAPSEESTIRKGLEYLIGLGHRKIMFFNIDDYSQIIPDRRWGFTHHNRLRRRIFEELTQGSNSPYSLPEAFAIGLPSREKSLEETEYNILCELKNSGKMPTAILCADVYAERFMSAAKRIGLKIPEDISILGIDDTDVCTHLRPMLSSIRQPLELMGEAAVDILVERMSNPDAIPVSQVFEVEVVERKSCGPASVPKE